MRSFATRRSSLSSASSAFGALKHALVKTTGELLTADLLPTSVRRGARGEGRTAAGTDAAAERTDGLVVEDLVERLLSEGRDGLYDEVHAEVDRVLRQVVLERVDGNQVEAARRLGIARNTLRSRLRSLGLTVTKRMRPEAKDEEDDEDAQASAPNRPR